MVVVIVVEATNPKPSNDKTQRTRSNDGSGLVEEKDLLLLLLLEQSVYGVWNMKS
jgi:hypothetical protein